MSADADVESQASTPPTSEPDDASAKGARLRVTPSDRGATIIVLAHLLPVWWLVTGGGLYLDDLRAQAYAREQPFWSFIFSSNGTHLAPGPRTLDWLQMHYAPLEHGPAVVATLATHLALGAVLWILLRELVGPRPAALVPLTIALMTPALLSATAWYRQALTTLLPLVFILAAAICAVRLVRSQRKRYWTGGAVALIAVAMLFSERALAGCALVVALAVLVPSSRSRTRSVIGLTAPLAVLAVGYVVVYRSGPFDQGTPTGLSPFDFLDLLVRSMGLGVLPALVGGPWRWSPSGPALAVPDAPLALALLADFVVLGTLAATARHTASRSRVARAVLIGAAYVLPVEAFVFIGRSAAFGIDTAANLRLFADCAVVLCVVFAVALLGWAGPPVARPAMHAASGRRQVFLPTAVALVGLLVVVGGGTSWSQFAARWHTTATPAYLAALRSDLDQAGRAGGDSRTTVLPGPIPDDVVPGWMQTEISTLDLVALLRPTAELALSHPSTTIVGSDGHLLAAGLLTVQDFDPGDSTFCHHPVQPGATEPTIISSPQVVSYKRDEMVELGMLVNDERRVGVDVVGSDGVVTPVPWPHPTTLQRGPYVVRLRVPYGVDVAAVRIHPDSAAGMCVVSVRAVVPTESR